MTPQTERQLRARIDELEEEVRQLKEAFAPPIGFPAAWKLTRQETILLAALHATRSPFVPKHALHLRMCGFDAEAGEKTVDVVVWKVRQKLMPHGVEIRARHGEGYYLEPASRRLVAEALAEAVPPQVTRPALAPLSHRTAGAR